MSAGRKQEVADAFAVRALLEKSGRANRADVRLIGAGFRVVRNAEFFETAARPEEEFKGTASNRVTAAWADEVFVSFAILFQQPVEFGESHCLDQVNENACHDDERSHDQHIFEISAGEMFVNDEADPQDQGEAKPVKQGCVNGGTLLEEELDSEAEHWKKNR